MFKIVITLLLFGFAFSMQIYQKKIPNGESVPNPCNAGTIWNPVGHYNPDVPTSLKNQFGKAFAAVGHQWTTDLCRADSDGDGTSNGAELGDPFCLWKEGDAPQQRPIGHPGICEPVAQGHCHHQHFSCDCMENCHGLH